METTIPTETADVETSSEDYARRFSGAVGTWFLNVQESATLSLLEPHREATVLDVGGGHGQIVGVLATHGYRVTVFGSADVCRRRIQPFIDEGKCAFRAGDLLALPYPDRHFDVVLSYRLLPHVARWKALLVELGRVARHAVLVDYPARRSVNCLAPWLFALKKRLERNTRTFTLFGERELLQVFESIGFVREGRYGQFFLPMALHRALEAPRLSSVSERVFRTLGVTGLFGSPIILKLVRRTV